MEFWNKLDTNEKGHLEIAGCDAVELAKEFGTPLYVMEEDKIRSICTEYKKALDESSLDGLILYASKAFMNTAMCKIIESQGMGMDVVSAGEMYTALHAGFPAEKMFLHGNNKTEQELRMAVEAGLGRIVIDSFAEIDTIDKIAAEYDKVAAVSLRIKPGVEAHTHEYIKTGMTDSKFGFGIDDGEAFKAVGMILKKKNLLLKGLHCHIGSQIFELEPFEDTVDIMTDFVLSIENEFVYGIKEINFGGGYGIHYVDGDKPLRPEEYVRSIIKAMEQCCERKGLKDMSIVMEPGRSIVGEAGTTLYTVGTIKDIPGIRTYISVDGGMTDNPRPALYQANYTATIADRPLEKPDQVVSVAGRNCESGDMLIWDIELNQPKVGDTLAVFSTGAYNYSMASNYNRVPVAAVVLVKDGKAELMVKRQTLDDLIKNDCVPSWIK